MILMQLLVKEINGVVNESHGDIASFYKIADTLGDLQKKHKLLIAFTEHQKAVSTPQASLAVQYRGHWFYIGETDLISKSTFLVLSEIYRLSLVGSDRPQAPLLTLPLGGP